MSKVGRRIETPTATLELVAPRLVVQRYRPDARFDEGVFVRNRKARWRIVSEAPHALLIILPLELQVHPPSANHDHFRDDSNARIILALAVVAPNPAVNAATKFYFRYYPQAFEARVFEEEEEARTWLQQVLAMG